MASILRERLALNPSLEQHLFAAYLDKDLAEACLNRYPDFDKEALAGALADSPRAIILSGSRLPEEEQYAEHVIQAAEKRLESHHKSVEQQKSIFEEFNKQHGLAYQGLSLIHIYPRSRRHSRNRHPRSHSAMAMGSWTIKTRMS